MTDLPTIVLVGHSYGGAVIGEAARGAGNAQALVFIGAYILEQGESIFTVLDPDRFPGGLLGPDTTIARTVPNTAAPRTRSPRSLPPPRRAARDRWHAVGRGRSCATRQKLTASGAEASHARS